MLADLDDYIDRHLDTVTAELLEKKFYYSRTYYNKLLKKRRGMGLVKYIQKRRIDAACRMLLETGSNIKQISYAVGYENTDFFYRLFKRLKGCTPSEYRRSSLIK